MQLHQLDVPESGALAAWADDHRHVGHGTGEDGRSEPEPVLGARGRLVELVLDGALLLGTHRVLGHQLLNVDAVPTLQRHSASRGMRLRDVPFLLQPSELIPDGGGGEVQPVPIGQRARRNGRGRVDVLVDDQSQYLGTTPVEHPALQLALSGREC